MLILRREDRVSERKVDDSGAEGVGGLMPLLLVLAVIAVVVVLFLLFKFNFFNGGTSVYQRPT